MCWLLNLQLCEINSSPTLGLSILVHLNFYSICFLLYYWKISNKEQATLEKECPPSYLIIQSKVTLEQTQFHLEQLVLTVVTLAVPYRSV